MTIKRDSYWYSLFSILLGVVLAGMLVILMVYLNNSELKEQKAFEKACYDKGKVVIYIPSTRESKCVNAERIYYKG